MPILFMQGHENSRQITPEKLWNNNLADYLCRIGAIIVTLEHQYFGHSFAQGFGGCLFSYDPLMLVTALMDAVKFVK